MSKHIYSKIITQREKIETDELLVNFHFMEKMPFSTPTASIVHFHTHTKH